MFYELVSHFLKLIIKFNGLKLNWLQYLNEMQSFISLLLAFNFLPQNFCHTQSAAQKSPFFKFQIDIQNLQVFATILIHYGVSLPRSALTD